MTLTEELHAKHHIPQGVVWNVHRRFCQKADFLNSKISDLLRAVLLSSIFIQLEKTVLIYLFCIKFASFQNPMTKPVEFLQDTKATQGSFYIKQNEDS